MERDCEDCGFTFTDNRYFKGELPKNAFCQLCCSERFFADVEHGNKILKEETWNFRSNWNTKVWNSSSLYEEGSDFLHIDVKQEKLELQLAIKKREGSNDEFLVWIGDKQFICKAEPIDEEARHEQGKILSEHSPLEILDKEI